MDKAQFETSPSGSLVQTPEHAWAFVPAPLPPTLDFGPVIMELAEASRAIGELNGIGRTLDNPYLLIRPLQTKEALTSSSMEGTYTTLDELMLLDAGLERDDKFDTREVWNYSRALKEAIDSLESLPLCLRLICNAHATLLRGVTKCRGSSIRPGEFKTQQNWIGARTIDKARFVPPPPQQSIAAMNDLERYIQRDDRQTIPALIDAALIHYQFETIHPFPDGNGRVGRILIPVFLFERGVIQSPLLYLSPFFEEHKDEYIDLMYGVSRTGDWISWIEFFLHAIRTSAERSVQVADQLLDLRASYRASLQQSGRSALLLSIADYVFERPVFSIPQIAEYLGVTYRSAQKNVDIFMNSGIVEELPETSHPKYFAARDVLLAISNI